MRLPWLRLLVGLVLVVPKGAVAAAPNPVVEGPVEGGGGVPVLLGTTRFPLADVGYEQVEYFVSGTATAFVADGALGPDGHWSVTAGETEPYKTRILVYRPIDPKRFRGTVLVEWLNVSGGLEAAADWIAAHTEMVRAGMAWVGVSAQFQGVEGGGGGGGLEVALKTADPERYGSLSHPGDSFSYDIFSQAGQAIRSPTGTDPMAGLKVKQVIAIGESQSAFRLVTYIDALQPLHQVYQGFLVHSRSGAGAPLSQSPQPDLPVTSPTFIRDDLTVPVLTFETETDLTVLGFFKSRQPDTRRLRTWEVAGTAHADTYTLSVGMGDRGDSPAVADVIETADPIPGILQCDAPVNSGPQHFVLDAAVAALDRWVRTGKAPKPTPPLDVAGEPPAIVRDAHGNAQGGIRTPWVDVPVATLSGGGQSGGGFCFLFGTTTLFPDDELAMLYPTHDAYVKAYKKATRRALRAGVLLAPDARLMKAAAEASDIGG